MIRDLATPGKHAPLTVSAYRLGNFASNLSKIAFPTLLAVTTSASAARQIDCKVLTFIEVTTSAPQRSHNRDWLE